MLAAYCASDALTFEHHDADARGGTSRQRGARDVLPMMAISTSMCD